MNYRDNTMEMCKHSIDEKTVEKYILVFIMIVVLFQVVATLFPEAQSAGDTLNSSGMPLGGLFATGGAVWYILAGAIIFLVVRSFMNKSEK